MQSYLFYWKEYWNENRRVPRKKPDWRSRRLYAVEALAMCGGDVWVVISGGKKDPDGWRLLEHLSIRVQSAKEVKKSEGQLRVVADRKSYRSFQPARQSDAAAMLRKLSFKSGKRIKASGKRIGMTLQSPRQLALRDEAILRDYAQGCERAF